MKSDSLVTPNLLALALPAALMAGAWGAQIWGGLYPCEMCHWQRWPHYAAIVLALTGLFVARPVKPVLIALAALAILTSGAIGVFHAGVEYHWWEGLTTCSTPGGGSLSDIMHAPLIRCDVPQWTVFGVSLAGFNAIISIAGGIAILSMVGKRS